MRLMKKQLHRHSVYTPIYPSVRPSAGVCMHACWVACTRVTRHDDDDDDDYDGDDDQPHLAAYSNNTGGADPHLP